MFLGLKYITYYIYKNIFILKKIAKNH